MLGSDGYVNRWFLDPIFRGTYPRDQQERYEAIVGPLDFIRDGDLETIAQPTDLLGLNYYAPRVDARDARRPPVAVEGRRAGGPADDGRLHRGVPQTEAGTPIVPHGLTDLLVRIRDDYGDIPIVITENGAVFKEPIHDAQRVDFIHGHVGAVHDAIELGVNVEGYCHWSLMDNFEWALGYAQRFGLVHVDYETLERTVKDSGRYFARIAAANALVEP